MVTMREIRKSASSVARDKGYQLESWLGVFRQCGDKSSATSTETRLDKLTRVIEYCLKKDGPVFHSRSARILRLKDFHE